jgi:hypothetical protein
MSEQPITKSPFFIKQEFISPKICNQVISNIAINRPNYDLEGYPIPYETKDEDAELMIFERVKQLIPTLETLYDAKYQGTEELLFQQFSEGMRGPAVEPHCESSAFIKKKWLKVKDIDLTCIIWLNKFQDIAPIDPRTEVYGGKLEFPAYGFGLVPEAGTMVVFPAGPHFIWAISQVQVGTLFQVKFNIKLRTKEDSLWLYNPKAFAKGGWREWLKNYL